MERYSTSVVYCSNKPWEQKDPQWRQQQYNAGERTWVSGQRCGVQMQGRLPAGSLDTVSWCVKRGPDNTCCCEG